MNEYMNIISKEAITATPQWMFWTILAICLISLVVATTHCFHKRTDKAFKCLICSGVGIFIFELISCIICLVFFQVPTGRYKYEATIDKNKITVSQYEEFIEEYNPTIKDGVYYWEDKVE